MDRVVCSSSYDSCWNKNRKGWKFSAGLATNVEQDRELSFRVQYDSFQTSNRVWIITTSTTSRLRIELDPGSESPEFKLLQYFCRKLVQESQLPTERLEVWEHPEPNRLPLFLFLLIFRHRYSLYPSATGKYCPTLPVLLIFTELSNKSIDEYSF